MPHADPASRNLILRARRLVQAGRADEAAAIYAPAAEAGLDAAQYDLGCLHAFGMLADSSLDKARDWLLRAAAQGQAGAMHQLAVFALGDRLLPRNMAQINDWLRRSAQAGFPAALRALALFWRRYGRAEVNRLGTLCLEHAALGGDRVSMALLIERLREGIGCAVDPRRADAIASLLTNGDLPIEAPRTPVDASEAEPRDLPPLPDLPSIDLAPALAAPALRVLSPSPWVAIADEAFSPEECRFVQLLGAPQLIPSITADPGGKLVKLPVRTSHDAPFLLAFEDVYLRVLQTRMAAAAELPLANGEELILLRYRPGQEYRPHRDYLPPSMVEPVATGGPGQRQATVIAYLNRVAAGGHTQFPDLGLNIPATPGSLLAFRNLDGDGQPDARTLHAGLPVIAGEKWICTLWLRQAAMRRL